MKDFKNYYLIQASPEEVYLALTNPITISLWTGAEAVMSTEPGSEFSLWDDSIVGKNIEFIENKKIVQQWYFGDQLEESMVTFLLHPDKKQNNMKTPNIYFLIFLLFTIFTNVIHILKHITQGFFSHIYFQLWIIF